MPGRVRSSTTGSPRQPPVRSARGLPHSEAVYAALRKRILAGDLNPGTPLREEELGRTHQVSRTPVREALTRLESEGLAARDPRNGLIVSRPSLDEIVDLYVLREALEGLAANLVAERRTELDLARLELLVTAAEDGLKAGNTTRGIRMSTEFHSLMWRLSGNRPLQHALADVHEAVDVCRPVPSATLAAPTNQCRNTPSYCAPSVTVIRPPPSDRSGACAQRP